MNAPSPAMPVPRNWWRRNLPWLLGTLLVAAVAFAVPYRDALHEYRQRHASVAIDVARGEWGELHDARWRLVSAKRIDARDPRLRGPLRADAEVLLVRYDVVPAIGSKTKLLDQCRGRLVDDRGRRWDAGALALPRLDGDRYPATCGSGVDAAYQPISAMPSRPFRIEHLYLIPRGLPLDTLHAEIGFPNDPDGDGRALRFAF